jgi:hypothetical protein
VRQGKDEVTHDGSVVVISKKSAGENISIVRYLLHLCYLDPICR